MANYFKDYYGDPDEVYSTLEDQRLVRVGDLVVSKEHEELSHFLIIAKAIGALECLRCAAVIAAGEMLGTFGVRHFCLRCVE